LIGTDLGRWSPSGPPWEALLSGTVSFAFLAMCGAGFVLAHRRRRRRV
jgi:ABC-type phosphate transport system auxiliary subunit